MKKVLFLNLTAFSQTGGIEKFNKCFLKALSELDAKGISSSNSISAYDTSCSIDYYPVEKYQGYAMNKAKFVINSIIKARNYDIIVLGHINMAIVGTAIKKLMPQKKLVLITHGIDVWGELTGAKKKVLSLADKILSVSSFTKKKLMDVHYINEEKVDVFPNTIDPYFPQPTDLSIRKDLRERYNVKDDEFLLYTLTRLSSKEQYKGYDRVIEALAEVVNENKKVKYIIAGKYDEQEKQKVDQLIAKNNLDGHVQLLGFIDEEELVGHYQMADLYIMPSKNEGFGIVFIEALVCGLPVIGGNCDGSTDALLNGETGTLVSPENINEIAKAIQHHIKLHVRKNTQQLKINKEKTLANFSFDKYKERLEGVIISC